MRRGWSTDTLKVLHDEQIRNDRQQSKERFGFLVLLGGVVAMEIYRRLSGLNHENARILAAQASSVSADTYSANESQRREERNKLDVWRTGVDEKLTQAVSREEVKRDVKTERRLDSGLIVAIVVAALAAIAIVLAMRDSTGSAIALDLVDYFVWR